MKKNSKTKNPEKKPTKKEKTQAAAALTDRPSIAPTRAKRGSVPLTSGENHRGRFDIREQFV
jgi:hypothetical protein